MRFRKAKSRRKFLAALSFQLHSPAGALAMKAEPAKLDRCVETALLKQPNVPKRNLRVEASDGRVTLHGTVHSYYQKQMAQEALRRLEGVQTIDNRIEVSWTR
jgi:osmotically-inducible protein OsmY